MTGAVTTRCRAVVGIDTGIFDATQPIVPGDVPAMHQDCLIMTMISYVFEEEAAAKQRDLEGGNVNVGIEGAPCVCAYGVCDESREQAVEVEEEENGQDAAYEQFNEEDPASVNLGFRACPHRGLTS